MNEPSPIFYWKVIDGIKTYTIEPPSRGTEKSAGLDICSNEDLILLPKERRLIKTGIQLELPKNTYGRLESKSSLTKMRIDVETGIIDQDYRGEIHVFLQNNSQIGYKISKKQQIAQLIICEINYYHPILVDNLSQTERGSGGFGSTLKIK